VSTPFDQIPEYVRDEVIVDIQKEHPLEYREVGKNDYGAFSYKHSGHMLENLTIIENSFYSEGPYFDPHRILYFETTNGKETFLIKRWRTSVLEPVRYEVVPAKLEVTTTVEIQRQDLKKQLVHEMREPSTQEKVERFIEIVQEEAQQIDPVHCAAEAIEVTEANISFVPLVEEQIARILKKSSSIFTPEELSRLERFIRQNAEYNGVMTFLIKKSAVFHPENLKEPLAN
jgi:hypothetical protein